ncbi:hypothetical protein CAAN1_12S00672 [[Candida] anglica]|uniref:Uncharacterized protein n=1 Tax=[Candida] anglica TaxID=148631 RepID=A0ABP0EBK6_9ASCO
MSVLGYVTGTSASSRRSSVSVSSNWRTVDTQAATSANDVFAQLTIKQIQSLNRQYNENISVAKTDIHRLVGNKYRDLIDIAGDIDSMYTQTAEIDRQLSDLAYQTPSFVSFVGHDPQNDFNSSFRQERAATARQRAQPAILRNLITNTLLAFDLRLISVSSKSSKEESISSSDLIRSAKFYYSIEEIFANALNADKEVRLTFHSLKNNFISYLENQLCGYVGSDGILAIENVLTRRGNRFGLANGGIGSNDGLASDSLFDDVSEFYRVDYTDYADILGPVESCLVAYIILNRNNSDLDTIAKVRENFLSLRYNYLSSLFADVVLAASETRGVNFFTIFQFIEDTYDLVERCLQSTEQVNAFSKVLKNSTSPWKASEVLGFRHWFESDVVTFRTESQHATTKPHFDAKKFSDLVEEFGKNLLQGAAERNSIETVVDTYQGFVGGLDRISENHTDSRSASLLRPIVTSLLDLLTKQIRTIYSIHFDSLVRESDGDTIMSAVHTQVSNGGPVSTNTVKLFSQEIVELLNSDIDRYMSAMSKASTRRSSLGDWFVVLHRYHQVVAEAENVLGAAHAGEKVTQRFHTLNSELDSLMWIRIDICIRQLQEELATCDDLHSWYYILRISTQLKESILGTVERSQGHELDSRIEKIDEVNCEICEKIVERVPNKTFNKIFESVLKQGDETNGVTDDETEEENIIPTRPSFRLSTAMYHLANVYMETSSFGNTIGESDGRLFQEKHVATVFSKAKTKWILGLSERLYEVIADLNDEQQKMEMFADAAYLVQFANSQGESKDEGEEEAGRKRAMELGARAEIKEDLAKEITNGVIEFYRSNKGLYLPLSL